MSEISNASTELAVRVFKTTPAVVSFNYQEISEHLDSVLEKYKGLVFSDKDVAECKKTIAELRKGQKSLDEFRKATKKQLTESVTAFELQCKVLHRKFETVLQPLTLQQEQFETDRKELKRVEIQSFISILVADHMLADKYAVQLIVLDEYLAKGKTIKAIKAELLALANTLSVQEEKEAQDIDLIKTKVQLANAQYQLLPPRDLKPEQYLRLLSLHPISKLDELITFDAQEAKKVYDAFDAIPDVVPEPVEVTIIPETYVAPEVVTPACSVVSEEAIAVYEVRGTEEQLSALEDYLDEHQLTWTDRS